MISRFRGFLIIQTATLSPATICQVVGHVLSTRTASDQSTSSVFNVAVLSEEIGHFLDEPPCYEFSFLAWMLAIDVLAKGV